MPERVKDEVFNRPPRIQPGMIEGEISIPAPPTPPDESGRNFLLSLLPMSGILIMGLFYLFISASTGRSPLFALPLLAMGSVTILSSLLTYSSQRQQQRRRQIKAQRDYHRMLDRREARLLAARDLQRHFNLTSYPPTDTLLQIIDHGDVALWNHRLKDEDFSTIRLGQGETASRVSIKNPDPDLVSPGIRRALDVGFEYRNVPDSSVTLHLLDTGSIAILGTRDIIVPYVYALLAQLVTLYLPGDLSLYVFSTRAAYRTWNWVRWLPHTSINNMGGFPDYVAYQPEDSRRLLGQLAGRLEQDTEETSKRGLAIVLVDEPSHIHSEAVFRTIVQGNTHGVICICLVSELRKVPSECQAVISVDNYQSFQVEFTGPQGQKMQGGIDQLSRTQADIMARKLNQFRVPYADAAHRIPASVNFLQMYGMDSISQLRISELWDTRRIPEEGRLPFAVPIGNIDYANQLMIDLRDNVHGPHGMIAGTTGAGKSELLRTLVAALAVEHHPYYLNFLLIDFKGGSTFNAFKNLPHTVGMLSNIDSDDPNKSRIEALRLLEAIKSENTRRQIFLKEKGFSDITDYHKQLKHLGGIPDNWEPLPHLIIIIDEFAELATELPDFIPELVSTVRVGRSLGMHLILAMQRPGNYVKEEMRANLQFRISLRVQSAEDSRDMLGRTEAANLPTDVPGRAYFQVGSSGLLQFQAARASIELLPEEDIKNIEINIVNYEQQIAIVHKDEEIPEMPANQKRQNLLDRLVEDMQDLYGRLNMRPMNSILMPSLSSQITLDEVISSVPHSWDGMQWQPLLASDSREGLVPVGMVDDIVNHSHTPLYIALEDRGGHFLVVGGPSSGKTTLLRTAAMSLANLYPPDQIEIYILGYGGHSLQPLIRLHHVGAVVGVGETERTERLLSYLLAEMEWRTIQFGHYNVENLQAYNRRAFAGDVTSELKPCTHIIVMIDNFAEFKSTHADEMDDLIRLMRNGAYGIHFVITASQLNDVPFKLQNLVEQRLALRLPEKTDYTLFVGHVGDRPLSDHPGSGLIRNSPPLHVQIALSGKGLTDALRAEDVEQTINRMFEAAEGTYTVRARSIDVLPVDVPLYQAEVAASMTNFVQRPLLLQVSQRTPSENVPPYPSLVVPVGLRGDTLQPMLCDLAEDGPHYLISGPIGAGKTNLLQVFTLALAERYSPQEVHILLVDFSNTGLANLATLPHVLGFAGNESKLEDQLQYLLYTLRVHVENEALRDQLCPIVVLIDVYDQMHDSLAPRQMDLLDQLADMIRRYPNLALHVLVASQSSGMPSTKLIKQLTVMRSGFALVDSEVVRTLGGRVTGPMSRLNLPDGRGFRVRRGQPEMVQIAHVDDHKPMLDRLMARWRDAAHAEWDVDPDMIAASTAEEPVIEAATQKSVNLHDVPSGELSDLLAEWVDDYKNRDKESSDEHE